MGNTEESIVWKGMEILWPSFQANSCWKLRLPYREISDKDLLSLLFLWGVQHRPLLVTEPWPGCWPNPLEGPFPFSTSQNTSLHFTKYAFSFDCDCLWITGGKKAPLCWHISYWIKPLSWEHDVIVICIVLSGKQSGVEVIRTYCLGTIMGDITKINVFKSSGNKV